MFTGKLVHTMEGKYATKLFLQECEKTTLVSCLAVSSPPFSSLFRLVQWTLLMQQIGNHWSEEINILGIIFACPEMNVLGMTLSCEKNRDKKNCLIDLHIRKRGKNKKKKDICH